MIRSALALVLTASVSLPAFAQSTDEKLWGALTSLKEKITAYDEGTGKTLAYYGGKTVKYSLIAVGAAYVTTAAPLAATEAAVRHPFFSRHFFSYNTPQYLGRLVHGERVANSILKYAGVPVAVGIGLIGASGVVFFLEHLYYGTVGHPDQAANNDQMAQFLALPVERQFEVAQANPELAERIEAIDAAVTLK